MERLQLELVSLTKQLSECADMFQLMLQSVRQCEVHASSNAHQC